MKPQTTGTRPAPGPAAGPIGAVGTTDTGAKNNGSDIVTGAQPAAPGGNPALLFKAKDGGQFVAPDGSVSLTIPPGALSQDAKIAITAIPTAGTPLTSFVPGIRFNLDLGGAILAPDHNLTVRAKLDSRFVATLKQRDPAFTPDKYSLTQDTAGQWFMVMTLHGPTTEKLQVPTTPPDLHALSLAEFGSFALPGGAATKPRQRHVLVSQADCDSWISTIGGPIPQNPGQWYGREGVNWDCGAMDGVDWFMNIFYESQRNVQDCTPAWTPGPVPTEPPPVPLASGESPPPPWTPPPAETPPPIIPPPPPPPPTNVGAHVTYISDDPTVNGTNASGVDVRFSFLWTPENGPSDVVTDANGYAYSYTLPYGDATITPYMALGPTSGGSVTVNVYDGMPITETQLPKYSPQIVMDLTAETVLEDHITVKYLLDGVEKIMDVPTPPGVQTGRATFYVRVPDDNDHTFEIEDVSTTWLNAMLPLPAAQQIHRTWQYPLALTLINLAPK